MNQIEWHQISLTNENANSKDMSLQHFRFQKSAFHTIYARFSILSLKFQLELEDSHSHEGDLADRCGQ